MITSEFEYYLLSGLIKMRDRELAQKIELHIWQANSMPNPKVVSLYLNALAQSEGPEDFQEKAAEIIKQSSMEFVEADSTLRDASEAFLNDDGNIGLTRPWPNQMKFDKKEIDICEVGEARENDEYFTSGLDRMVKMYHQF